MANHKSAIKRNRSNEAKHQRNQYHAKTMRSMLRKARVLNTKEALTKEIPVLSSAIDRLAKKGVIHKNKAANLKSKLMRKANKIGKAPVSVK
jgi:small subunit ribosomal protein S20